HDPVDLAVGGGRRGAGDDRDQYRVQHHGTDRRHLADRHRQKERDHDDRFRPRRRAQPRFELARGDRKSTRLNSSHVSISYAVFCSLHASHSFPTRRSSDLTILSTLPSAGAGAVLAMIATNTEFSIMALIGVILLIGIVKKNAIMMIDFALDAERSLGLSSREEIGRAHV